jgi:hypothetical protein
LSNPVPAILEQKKTKATKQIIAFPDASAEESASGELHSGLDRFSVF